MIQLRHTGLYVKDLYRQTEFYKYVFHMHPICEMVEQQDDLVGDLLRQNNAALRITKLITDQGKMTGIGDMLELIQVPVEFIEDSGTILLQDIYAQGRMHFGFGIDNINETVDKIIERGGTQFTAIHIMKNGNKCCFCKDPEQNWLELIERH